MVLRFCISFPHLPVIQSNPKIFHIPQALQKERTLLHRHSRTQRPICNWPYSGCSQVSDLSTASLWQVPGTLEKPLDSAFRIGLTVFLASLPLSRLKLSCRLFCSVCSIVFHFFGVLSGAPNRGSGLYVIARLIILLPTVMCLFF